MALVEFPSAEIRLLMARTKELFQIGFVIRVKSSYTIEHVWNLRLVFLIDRIERQAWK